MKRKEAHRVETIGPIPQYFRATPLPLKGASESWFQGLVQCWDLELDRVLSDIVLTSSNEEEIFGAIAALRHRGHVAGQEGDGPARTFFVQLRSGELKSSRFPEMPSPLPERIRARRTRTFPSPKPE
jgi:hypothetical protein